MASQNRHGFSNLSRLPVSVEQLELRLFRSATDMNRVKIRLRSLWDHRPEIVNGLILLMGKLVGSGNGECNCRHHQDRNREPGKLRQGLVGRRPQPDAGVGEGK